MDESLFVRVVVKDNIKIPSSRIASGVLDAVTERLQGKYEQICSRHGYIRKGSINVLKYSLGRVEMDTLNGDVTYVVQYSAEVANPTIGSIVSATVKNINKFGVLAESGVRLPDGSYVPVLDILIARQTVGIVSEVNLEQVQINDTVTVEVLAKKFEIGDSKISVVGRVMSNTKPAVTAETEVAEDVIDEGFDDDGVELVSDEEGDEEEEIDAEEEEDDAAFSGDDAGEEEDFFDDGEDAQVSD